MGSRSKCSVDYAGENIKLVVVDTSMIATHDAQTGMNGTHFQTSDFHEGQNGNGAVGIDGQDFFYLHRIDFKINHTTDVRSVAV